MAEPTPTPTRSVWTHGSPPGDFGHKPREYPQLVVCRACNYFLHITVQERRGTHGCAQCDGLMEVWEPRPERFGGLGVSQETEAAS